MPELTAEQKIRINTLLNLYDMYLKLALAVLKRKVVSSDVDDFYKQHGFESMLKEIWLDALSINIDIPPLEVAFPVTLFSFMDDDVYRRIQINFGLVKDAALNLGGVKHQMPEDVANMIALADSVLDGKTLRHGVSLGASNITDYDNDRSQLKINNEPVAFKVMTQSDYFNKIMFSFPKNTEVSWEQLNEQIGERFGAGERFPSSQSLIQCMYRINAHIKNSVGTKDDFYTQKGNVITRHFGPDVE